VTVFQTVKEGFHGECPKCLRGRKPSGQPPAVTVFQTVKEGFH